MIKIRTHKIQFAVECPYDDRLRIKAIPGAHWNATHLVWTIPATIGSARNIMEAFSPDEVSGDARFMEMANTKDMRHVKTADDLLQPEIRKTEAWRHQLQAYHFAYNQPAAMLAMAMGTGKSKCVVDLVINRKHKRTLIICPKSVLNVWRTEFEDHAGHIVYNDAKGSCAVRAKKIETFLALQTTLKKQAIVVINYEAAWREDIAKVIFAAKFDLVVCDECVPAGTMIDTPLGKKRIETLKEGDLVWGYNHKLNCIQQSQVKHCFKRITKKPLCKVDNLELTSNHPIWTEEKGYIPAGQLDTMGFTVVKLHRGDINDKNLQSKMRVVRERISITGAESKKRNAEILQPELCKQISNVKARKQRKSKAIYEQDATETRRTGKIIQASALKLESVSRSESSKESAARIKGKGIFNVEWGQWNGDNDSSKTSCSETRMVDGVCSKDQNESGISNMLQNRHCRTCIENCNRGGRIFSSFQKSKRSRQRKNRFFRKSRMENNSVLEQRNSGRFGRSSSVGRQVYNIETTTGNYFAEGILVHNCHRIKAPGGKASRFISRLGDKVPYRLALTGTPMAHSPLDIYAQYRFLDKGIFGTSFTLFRARYAVMGGFQGYEIRGYQNEDELRRKFESIAYQVKADVLDLPDAVHTYRNVELKPETMRVYNQMYHNFIVEVKEGTVTAANALSKLLRLQQITSGYLPVDDGMAQIGDEKKKALMDIFEDLPSHEPVVVFARFRHDLDQIQKAVESSGQTYMELSGRVNDLADWQAGKADILGVQIQAGGVGISLVRAHYCVYYSMGYSLGNYLQSVARLHRPGQHENVTYIHLVANGTVDEQVYAALRKRKQIIEEILK